MLYRSVVGSPHHAGNRGQHGANHKGSGNHYIGLHPHQSGHPRVLRRGAHGTPQFGVIDQPHQHRQRHGRHPKDQHLGWCDHSTTDIKRCAGHQGRVRLVVRFPDDHGERLQQQRHANGGDQRSELRAVAQRPVGHFFDDKVKGGGTDAGNDRGDQQNQPARCIWHGVFHESDDGPAGQRSHHQHFTMGKVDQPDDAVHHGVAQRYQGIHAAQHQTIDDLLYEGIHKLLRFLTGAWRSASLLTSGAAL